MEDDGKLILWGTLVVLLLIMIGIINLYLCAILVTLFNRSESDLRIRLLQNDFRIYFHFYSQTYKIETI